MIDDVILILVASNSVARAPAELETCSYSLVSAFQESDSGYKVSGEFISCDFESSVNIILTPDAHFETLFHVDDELTNLWYVLNGLHNFQVGQLFRYREATVFRFVSTIFTDSPATGSIYLMGDKYIELADKYEKEQHKLDSWINSKPWDRFTTQK